VGHSAGAIPWAESHQTSCDAEFSAVPSTSAGVPMAILITLAVVLTITIVGFAVS
jgi:hypothetical protein